MYSHHIFRFIVCGKPLNVDLAGTQGYYVGSRGEIWCYDKVTI